MKPLLLMALVLMGGSAPAIASTTFECGQVYRGPASEFERQPQQDLPEWWDNPLGVTNEVLPGYAPIRSGNGVLELSQRTYRWGKDYLPESITSRGSLLAEGIRLVARIDGKRVVLKPSRLQITQRGEVAVQVTASGEPIPGLQVTVDSRVEYDGMASSRIRLMPDHPIDLEGLDFLADIVDDPSMEVIAFDANGIRRQKDRHDLLELPYAGRFLNVLGFADGNRSFWWFADNAKGWIWNAPTVTEVTRANHRIRLRQRLIGSHYRLQGPITLRINFLATPVRELGSAWRSRRIASGPSGPRQSKLGSRFRLWWTRAFAHDAFPYLDYPAGSSDEITTHDRSVYPGAADNRRQVLNEKQRHGISRIPYFSAHVLSRLDPVLKRFQRYWEILPAREFKDVTRPYEKAYGKPVLTHRAAGYSNYLLWRLDPVIERLGIDGIYLDHGPPHDSCNPHNGGWTDSNGRLQPSLDILGLRRFLKRLRALFVARGRPGYIFIHTSNREILPAYTFAYAMVDGEQYRNGRVEGGNYLDALSLDEFRTRFAPDQYGVISLLLPTEWTYHRGEKGWQGSRSQLDAYRRTQALVLLHDLLDWPIGAHRRERARIVRLLDRFGIDRAEFIGYWDKRTPLVAADPHIKISAYRRQDSGDTLCVVANTADRPIHTTLHLAPGYIGRSGPDQRLSNEKGEALEIGSGLPIDLQERDFTLLILKAP